MSLTSFSNKKESRLVGEGEVTVSFFLFRPAPGVKHTQVAISKGELYHIPTKACCFFLKAVEAYYLPRPAAAGSAVAQW